jgi:hypothetical protein
MSRPHVLVALVFSGAVAALGCVGQSNAGSETVVLALGGTMATCSIGGSPGTNDFPAVRGFIRSDGMHEAAFRVSGATTIDESHGTPLGGPNLLANAAKSGTNAWGYKRHDGPDIVTYIDQNGHIHERGSGDTDFNTCCGINAPIAGSQDVVGYVRSDAKSGLVYRSSADHVIEVKSNFSSSPPWLAQDLTTIAPATVTAKGNPFPYVRADGKTTIVYRGSDNHIHELANEGPNGWFDNDLHVLAQEASLTTTDAWGFLRSDGTQSVQFVGTDSNLRQFRVIAGHWISESLARFVSNVRPSGYVGPSGTNSVVYIGFGATLHQLTQSNAPGAPWTDELLAGDSFGSNCVAPLSEPFGHMARNNTASILFLGRGPAMGVVTRYELAKSGFGGGWTLTTF